MRYRAIAVDIDGTLTDENLVLNLDAVRELQRMKEKGYEIILCSGNVLPIVYALSSYLGLRGPIVAENGGVVYHDKQVRVLADPKEAVKAFEYLQNRMKVRRLFTDRWRESEVGFYQDVSLEDVRAVLRDFDILVESSGYAIHLMVGNITKMDGIKALRDMTGISPEEVIAIGDGDNDSTMIAGCGYGIAVANASESAKKAADYITEMPYSEGFIEAVRVIEHIGTATETHK